MTGDWRGKGNQNIGGGNSTATAISAIEAGSTGAVSDETGSGSRGNISISNQSQKEDERPPGPREDVPFVDRLPFNLFVAGCVILNTLTIGLEQDLGPEGTGASGDHALWWLMGLFFVCCFVTEIVLRIFSEKKAFFTDVLNIMDMCLVAAALVDVLIFIPAGTGGIVRLFTAMRTLRIVRLVRLVRMNTAFRELWLLVGGLVNSLKALGWVGLVVIVVLYLCSIIVTTEIGQNDEVYGSGPSYDGEMWPYKEYFGTVMRSMFTLFQVVTLDAWCDKIVRHVIYRQPFMAVFFVVFVLITAFGLMNVIVGIIVENTLAAAQVADSRLEQHKAFSRKKAVEKLEEILVRSDVNRTGEISMQELQAAGQSPVVQAQFEVIGLKFEEAQEIFSLLDYERRGRIELKRFAASCRELVGGARRRDIAQVEITVGSLAQRLDSLDHKFSGMESEVRSLHTMADDFVQKTVYLLTGFDGTKEQQ
eukprot:TRINITY_DN50910_c0_g1_i1.p1 TRINITY_DN50910_c0_g1~~TRINITY_DN50910_c0_g1_i1.p1  ORF type:complete len:549 (+),score=125.50 TRINITY_DN50910_c0_g1_i1:219-1649(+)